VVSWGIGAKGEAATAGVLALLHAEGFIVLHDRLIPRSRANIDHIVLARLECSWSRPSPTLAG
ncbi:MAG: nuclease-related domain-containing protein, partial [Candidatus Limnocylindrales bacterium]